MNSKSFQEFEGSLKNIEILTQENLKIIIGGDPGDPPPPPPPNPDDPEYG
ncbi:MAG: hypothetical protein K9G58_15315 [Bacteroidales bacterium]|nr:hypothetical protein [Bacteroidales bacterium]MCF8387265.1 hypothetical protein [Bacteroidales bacterium]MCF8399538.1 hypothetical protein [Bacteroidales bacterium]